MDWLFKNREYICNFRTVGLLIKNGKVLVQREVNGSDFALPGGHVKVGESSDISLIREYLEETGVKIKVERLIWTEECFWKWNNNFTSTISFYYLIHLDKDQTIPDNGFIRHLDNPNVEYGWINVEDIQKINIYPRFLKSKINDIKDHPEHFVDHQW